MRGILFIEKCKDNMPKKVPLGLLEIEKRRGIFRLFLGYITTKWEFATDFLPVCLRLSMGLNYPFRWFR